MDAKTIELKLIAPEETLYDGPAVSVSLPGSVCPFEVLPDHAPIVSTLVKGTVSWVTADGVRSSVPVLSGVVMVEDNKVDVCVEKSNEAL